MAQATVDLGLNTAAFTAGLNEAERKSQSFEGRIAGLFKRSPLARAEHAFGDLAANLSTGNVAQGVASFAGRLTGLGLAAGVGIGAAVALFERAREHIDAANKSAEALQKELNKPLATQAALGPAGISAQLELIKKATEDFDKNDTWAKIGAFFKAKGTEPEGVIGVAGEELAKREQLRGDAIIRARQLAAETANFELKAANIKLQGITTSEKETALAEIALQAEQKRANIRLQRADDTPRNIAKAIEAVDLEEKAARMEVEKKFELKQREAEMESYILSIKDKGLTKEQESNETIKARIQLLQSQLGGARTEERLPLQNKITALQQQLTPELPARVNVSGFTLPEILKSGLEPVIDTDQFGRSIQNWRWPLDKNTPMKASDMGAGGAMGKWDDIGTGIDGIKQGVDTTNQKLDQLLAAWT